MRGSGERRICVGSALMVPGDGELRLSLSALRELDLFCFFGRANPHPSVSHLWIGDHDD